MGLIVKNIPVVSVQYVFTNNASSDLFNDVNVFDTSIYRILSMQDDMKTVSIRGQVNSEFELFLKYAEDKTLGTNVGAGFDALDNYLGTLGV